MLSYELIGKTGCINAPLKSESPAFTFVKNVKSRGRAGGLFFYRFGVIDAESVDRDLFHDLRDARLVVVVGTDGTDLIDFLDALNDLAEGSVLAVEMRGILMHDEELTARGIGSHGACHGEHAAAVEQGIVKAVCLELAADAVARAAGADALGVAALDHKAGDDAVENKPVIEAALYKGDEVVDGVGSDLGIKLSLHDCAVFHFKGDYGIAHE